MQVLPRQTCGLFTSTLSEVNHPKGSDYLYKSSHGGELFWSIVNNPVSSLPLPSARETCKLEERMNGTALIKKNQKFSKKASLQ